MFYRSLFIKPLYGYFPYRGFLFCQLFILHFLLHFPSRKPMEPGNKTPRALGKSGGAPVQTVKTAGVIS